MSSSFSLRCLPSRRGRRCMLPLRVETNHTRSPERHDGRHGPAPEQLRQPEDRPVPSQRHCDVQRRRHARRQDRARVAVRGLVGRRERTHCGQGRVRDAAAAGVWSAAACSLPLAAVIGRLRPQRPNVAPGRHLWRRTAVRTSAQGAELTSCCRRRVLQQRANKEETGQETAAGEEGV